MMGPLLFLFVFFYLRIPDNFESLILIDNVGHAEVSLELQQHLKSKPCDWLIAGRSRGYKYSNIIGQAISPDFRRFGALG